jgi:hypothetical protein
LIPREWLAQNVGKPGREFGWDLRAEA